MPKLSIITVTYNAGKVLEKTIQSIFSQTYDNYELIIIDGNSTDNTINIIQQYSSKIYYWISEPDNGIYDAMNKGLKIARGEYVQFLNAGDYFCDDQVLSNIFRDTSNNPTLFYGDIKILAIDNNLSYQKARMFTLDNLLKRGTGVLCHQAMFVRRSDAPQYDCKYKYKAELNWYFDIVESTGFTSIHVQSPVVIYALGGMGYKNFIRNRADWLRVVYNRYGLSTLIKSRIIIFLLKNSISRYPALNKPARLLKRTKSIFR